MNAGLINTVMQGDCLELMKQIPDKSIDMILCDLPRTERTIAGIIKGIKLWLLSFMDISEIKRLYVEEKFTLRMIAERFNTSHHRIKRILVKQGVTITRANRLRVFTQEHRDKIGASRKALYDSGEITTWSKGKKMSRDHVLKNMKAHLSYDVTLEWLDTFPDIEKLKFLNNVISRHKKHFDTIKYISYVERFYYDSQFNAVYNKWIENDKDKWLMPSIDHINPKANGGNFDLDNLRFISWFENRAKADMSLDEWEKVKSNISYYFV